MVISLKPPCGFNAQMRQELRLTIKVFQEYCPDKLNKPFAKHTRHTTDESKECNFDGSKYLNTACEHGGA